MNKFKANILEQKIMQISGSALLKLMQNKETPVLDLLVREAIQNSLDAALPNVKQVNVDIISDYFNLSDLSDKYELIEDALVERYKNERYSFLSISDSNTIGLIGNKNGLFSRGEKDQNLGKLVFQIMDPQKSLGAGGSWGIGKTIYYRIGIGLVIYYSRIKTENGYEERIISTLVEDEQSQNKLVKSANRYMGITYFGDENNVDDNPTVICDKEFIHEILSIFKIKPYSDDKTGTIVIIPFTDNEKLLNEGQIEEYKSNIYWNKNIESFLNMSILRWYFPRISEYYNNGPRLSAKINNKSVYPNENALLFSKLTEVYKCIISGNERQGVVLKDIERKQDFKSCSLGKFAFIKLSALELKTLGSGAEENFPSPFCYINKADEDRDQNSPIIMYCRKPGMIVSYETSGDWVGYGVNSEKDSFIVGLFVLNSNNKFKDYELSLEEYVRQSERADHISWVDHPIENSGSQKQIIRHITKKIGNILKSTFVEKYNNEGETSINRLLGKKFADLLPSYNYGNESSNDDRGRKTTNIAKSKSLNIKMLDKPTFTHNGIKIKFEINAKRKFKEATISLLIATTSKNIPLSDWEFNNLSPVCELENVFVIIDKVVPKELDYNSPVIIDKDKDIIDSLLSIKLLKTHNDKNYGIKIINNGIDSFNIKLAMNVLIFDNSYQIIFDTNIIEEEK